MSFKKWFNLTAVLLLPLFVSILAPPPITQEAYALNAFIDPNGDGSTGSWSSTAGTTFSTEIDEATRQPTIPTTSDNISAASNNGGSIYQDMTSIGSVTTVTDVRVWIYHNDGANGQILVQLYDEDETTTRSSQTALTQSSSNAWHSVLFSGLSLTQGQLDTLSVRMTANKNGGGSPATITVYAMYADVTYSNVTTAYEQSGYRLFNSLNSTNVGTPLAGLNSGAVLNAGGDEFRLRLLIHISAANLASSGATFKLQYVGRGTGSCASPSGGTPSTYTDVTTGTLIAYNNLTGGVSDGDALTTNASDPTHSSDTIVSQTVEEANNFTNSQGQINIGQDGMWDFALVDNGAPAATAYCLRVVKSDNSLLDTYTQYPQVTTGNGVLAVDIVDGAGTPVATPSVSMSSTGYLFTCDPTTGLLGTTSERVEISNFTATASWSVSIAATGGNTSVWSDGGTNTYDYNDGGGAPAGCTDSGDTDSVAGQLTINPSVGTSTPRAGCTNTGITLGSSASYSEAVTDSITLISASSSAQLSCSWQLTDVDLTQQIPQDQANGSYTLNFTITAVAV